MNDQDLIQEANIVPVINIDSGTPLSEHHPFPINSNNFQINRAADDNRSEKSSLLDTSHKVFEKLTGSLTALGKSIRTSLSSKEEKDEGELEFIEKSIESDIDVMGTSSHNRFVATWSSGNGVLAVFPTDNQLGPRKSIFRIRTPFDKKSVTSEHKIYISVSEDGQYVAISRMFILKEYHTETPNMDDANVDKIARAPESSFIVYSIKNSRKQDDSVLYSLEILGPLIFVHHNSLICFTKNNMHLFSTKHWILQNSVQIDALVHSLPNYSNNCNDYLTKLYDILIESLKYGYLIWPEEKSGLSVWDINGILRQWFYIEAKNIVYTRNLFAISPKGNLVARFFEEKRDDSGSLCIFHVPTALTISDVEVPKSTFFISFLHKTDQIILCSREGEGVRVQLWDCWAGLLVFEEQWTFLHHDKPLLLIGDKFLQAVGSELYTYRLFQNNSPSVTMEALRKSSLRKTDDNRLKFYSMIEMRLGMSMCWGHISNDKDYLLCKFKFEPWHFWNDNEIFIHWLDSKGKRFLLAGKDSVQIYKTKQKSDQEYLNMDLQYIWISKTEEIKLLTLETREENNIKKSLLHVQLTNNNTVTLPLPEDDDKVTFRVVSDACAAIHCLRIYYMDEVQYFDQLVIRKQLKKLIESSIQQFPSAFNKITLECDEYFCPMEDFIMLGWDDIVKSIIETDRYIPIFHNEEQTENALLLLVELQKSELVELMINYIIKHMKQRYVTKNRSMNFNMSKKVVQQPGFAWTLGKTLLDLYKYYPDKGIYVMKESSYFTTSLEAPTRILQTNLGILGQERSYYHELKGVASRARLPKGTKLKDTFKKRGFYDSLFNKYFKSQGYNSSSRSDTGAFFYDNPEGTNYSDKKQDVNKLTYGIRQRQRRQRLEDAKKTHPAKLCVVPWPDFCVYPPIHEHSKHLSLFERILQFWNVYVSPTHRSPFAEVALNGPSEMFGEVVMEAVIKFKWDKFARKIFLWNFSVYLVHMILFCTIVSIHSDLVPDNGQLGWKAPVFIIESLIPMILLIQEFRQMSGRWRSYWSSSFNYVDLASFGLPLVCTLMVVLKVEPPPGLKSFAVLCVWFNAMLQARAFAEPGKFVAIVIEIGKKIVTLFIALFVMILGFANALFVLLRDEDDLSIVQTYNGTLTTNNGESIGQISMHQDPQSNTNMWKNPITSVLATYFFLGIGWDSVTTINPNPSLYIIMVLFSLLAVVVLLNVLIGLITDVFSGSLPVGRQAWLRQRAELIAELEIYSLLPSHRQHPDWFPHLVYYEAHLDAVKNWKRKLYIGEMGELDADFVRRELKNVRDDLNDEIKELKGMVGQIRLFMKIPTDGNEIKSGSATI